MRVLYFFSLKASGASIHMCGYCSILCSWGLFHFKTQSVLTQPVSSYHKQTHIASPPDPLITTLLSCRLSYVRLHNTRSVWVIFHNLGVPLHWHCHQNPSGVESKVRGRFGGGKNVTFQKKNNSKLAAQERFIASIIFVSLTENCRQEIWHERLFFSFIFLRATVEVRERSILGRY